MNMNEKKKIACTHTHTHTHSNAVRNTCSIILNSVDMEGKKLNIFAKGKSSSNSKTKRKHVRAERTHTQTMLISKQFLTCFNRSESIASVECVCFFFLILFPVKPQYKLLILIACMHRYHCILYTCSKRSRSLFSPELKRISNFKIIHFMIISILIHTQSCKLWKQIKLAQKMS